MRALVLALVVALSPPAFAADYGVTSHCGWTLFNTAPGSPDVVLALVAEAHASGDSPASTTTVTCTVTNKFGETLTATGSSVGDHVYTASGRIMSFAPPEYCVSSRAVWLDPLSGTVTHEEVEPEHCEDIDW